MSRSTLTTLAVIAGLVLISAFAWHWYKGQEVFERAPQAEAPVPPAPPPPPRYPVPEPSAPASEPDAQAPEPEPEPLPPLSQSDAPLRDLVGELFGRAPIERFLVPDSLIRRIVVSVDNLPDSSLGMRFRAIKPIEGDFEIDRQGEGAEQTYWMSPRNYARYDGFVAALQAADIDAVVALYFRYYPLFQASYRELGYPSRYFNDRVIEVIDHLLAAPQPEGPIELVRPKVLYHYKDADLQALSVGHKAMIRMGPENAAAVRAWLRELRAAIVAGVRERQSDESPGEAAPSG